jgi:prepilin-type N-terminal cleavage/methylation domain-containing protein
MYIDKLEKKQESGMTMVELLVVIAVFSLLVTGLIVTINPTAQIQKSNDAKRKSDLTQLQRVLEAYYQDKGKYPANPGPGNYTINDGSAKNWGTSWSPYITKLPKDPLSTNTYVYFSPTSGACLNNQCYFIYANLQQAKDPQACNGGNPCSSLATNSIPNNACGGICNYVVSSPNVAP